MSVSSLFRSSAVMAAGTAVSRLLGFARIAVLATALGTNNSAADGFDIANKIPNILYMLLIGGVLNAILVPQIVAASKSEDDGHGFLDRLITLALLVMGGLTLVLTVAAPLLMWVYTGGKYDQTTTALIVSFAYICIPQVFFYGLYAVLGQVLNARGSFGPYMWAPVANNVLALIGLGAFIGLYGTYTNSPATDPAQWTTNMVVLLAGSATTAVAAQAIVLIPFLRKIGYRYKPAWGFRGFGFGSARSVASWTLAGLAIGQAVYALTSQVATQARAETEGTAIAATTPGIFVYSQAFLLFMLPHSLIVVSLVTAMFTRLSEAAADDRVEDITRDTQNTVRVVSVIMMLAATGLIVLREHLALLLSGDPVGAPSTGMVIAAMSVGLVAFSSNYALQRVAYAFQDGKSVFVTQIPNFAVMVLINVASLVFLPPQWMVVGVGVGMSVGNIVGLVALWATLHRRLPALNTLNVVTLVAQLLAISVVVGAAGSWLLTLFAGLPDNRLGALIAIAAVGTFIVVGYLGGLRLMRVKELTALRRILTRRS